MRKRFMALTALPALCAFQPAMAQQQIEKGVTVQRGWFNSRTAIEPIQVKNLNGSQIKGMQRVAISVFNVEFPDEYRLVAKSSGSIGGMISHRSATLDTRLVGMDLATRQKITDIAYTDFVTELKAAGFDVMDHAALVAAAPEMASWASLPARAPNASIAPCAWTRSSSANSRARERPRADT